MTHAGRLLFCIHIIPGFDTTWHPGYMGTHVKPLSDPVVEPNEL